ncbi:GYF domain-containing protein [Phanerochaete sordida]|uniref:GYF domain-containing protein n=1 Tax=Phanerochaete sordida TaxID=48140 RepID=A0A9P3G4D7_9APHY|nr:GYF domain-containing protein [Phanerochaete sordida]
MTTTTMHFGPEWMRTKQAPTRTNPSPPLTTSGATGASSYSALVTPATQAPPEKRDLAHPFRYSKEDLIRIYKEGGGKGGLGLEVERWEGIVRELGADPVSLKGMSEPEKKLFAGPLNSEMRRRPSVDYLALSTAGLTERPKLNHSTTGPNSPLRERLGGYMGRRRENSTDQPPLTLPRKPSLSSIQAPLLSPREALPSPRTRIPGSAGIDGVLSDSWSIRRRTSEGLLKVGGRTGELGDSQDGPQTTGIKEEEEEHRASGQGDGGPANGNGHAPQNDPPPQSPLAGRGEAQANADSVSAGVGKLTLKTQGPDMNAGGVALQTPVENAPAGPPPGITDLSTVEWSYLDPQGHVQGPFPASTMQKWYDEGYFQPSLMMKRTKLDQDWTSVAELLQRAGNPRMFLTPLPNVPPPGLLRRDPLLGGPAPDGTFGSPFQPAPARLRTMDSHLHNGSLVPDSPSSSFSAGRFSNASPDPAAFGGRLGGHHFAESPVGPRLATLVGNPMEPQRRPTFEEGVDGNPSARVPFAGFTPGRTGSVDGLGFHPMENQSDSTGPFSPVQGHENLFGQKPGFHAARPSQGSPMIGNGQPAHGLNDFNGSPYREGPRLFARESFDANQNANIFANGGIHYPTNGQPFGQGQVPYGSQMHGFPGIPDRQPTTALAQRTFQQPFMGSPVASPWPPQDAAIRRPAPFDSEFPSRTTVVPSQRTITPSQSQAPQAPQVPAQQSNEQSPWVAASQGIVSDGWTSDSLTAANLGQHNRQQEEEAARRQEVQPVPAAESPVADGQAVPEGVAQPDTAAVPAVSAPEPSAASKKQRRKATDQAAAPSAAAKAAVPAPTAAPVAKSPSPPLAQLTEQSKPVWGSVDDEKKKATPTLGLREIQEMEAKKLEVRKAAERERERAARAAASPTASEEVQTLSWGLPTSQVGARTAAVTKESAVSQAAASPVATNSPVWTTAAKAPAVKKTMKEIQEEEERRKKVAAKEKETVAAAARRAYADTTTKAASPVQTGGAWTTVGVGGKANAAVATPPARPALTTVTSTKTVAAAATPAPSAAAVLTRTASTPAPTRSPVVTTSVKLAPAAPKEEAPSAPSLDFMKWMTDSLKGLNNSVNLEEISSMLLSFPLDPDSSTVEIISDLIYANSTTLDGRRFAAEFVSKRKADAKAPAASASVGKTLSIADVVKTQPKPAQNEWGGFKVVNKKKKTGRA